jgi:hypothetical protein
MAVRPDHFDRLADNMPGISRSPAAVRRRVEGMERLLEGLITIPGTNKRIGLDVLLDFIPFAGPTIATLMGAWIVWEARNLGASKWLMARMASNVALDTLFSAIPLLGAIPDYFFRSNTRNLRLLGKFLDKRHPGTAVIEG